MSKLSRFIIPLTTACLLLSGLYYLLGTYKQGAALASSSPFNAAILVTTLADEFNSDGDCSLREALQASNYNIIVDACAPGTTLTDTIAFNSAGTITLASELGVGNNNKLVIDGADAVTLRGAGITRILSVSNDSVLKLDRLSLIDGYAEWDAGCILNWGELEISRSTLTGNVTDNSGGAIENRGNLVITASLFSENSAGDGGAINNGGSLTVVTSTFSTNEAFDGAAIYNTQNNTAIISDSFITGNVAVYGGGGIVNAGTLTVTNSTVSPNHGGENGGGFSNGGNLTIIGTEISNNEADYGGCLENGGRTRVIDSTFTKDDPAETGDCINNYSGLVKISSSTLSNSTENGGGIYNIAFMDIEGSTLSGYHDSAIINQGTITITQSTLTNNTSPSYGGGLINWYPGKAKIITSTISANSAVNTAGGIFNEDSLVIINSTISGNLAPIGGAITNYPGGDLSLYFTTVADNVSESGPSLYNYHGEAALNNTILSNVNSAAECDGAFTDAGHNISPDNTCGLHTANDSHPFTNPHLGPLQDNGGPTWTHALLWNSPAIDAGENTNCPLTDQRGMPRPMNGDGIGSAICDIGSYELQALMAPYIFYVPLVDKSH